MAAFEYRALDTSGKQKRGVLEADSVRQIRQILRDQGLVPLDVVATQGVRGETAQPSTGLGNFARRLGQLDRVLFTRQLSTLVGAGLPIEEALQAVAKQSDKQHINALVMAIRSRVLEGHSLAAALADHPGSFNDLFRSTVAAGEQSGYLDRVLENLADYQERQFDSSRNVQMALFYPIILFCLALLIVGGLMIYVVPDMVGVIENMGQALPPLTRFLISTSEFLQAYWWLLGLTIIAVVIGIRFGLKQPRLRLAWDHQKLYLPLVSRIVRSGNAARYANTLSILTSSGVPLVEAMGIAANVVDNQYLKQRLAIATQRVSEGSSLRAALETVGQFPPMLLYMVASGENSGELDQMLSRVAQFQQAEVERIVTTTVKIFEPLMLLLMGGLVMFIVMAILLPILNMQQMV